MSCLKPDDVVCCIDAACDLLVVEFNLPSDVDEADSEAIQNWFTKILALQRSQRVGIYKFWDVLYQDEKPDTLPTYMALVSLLMMTGTVHSLTRHTRLKSLAAIKITARTSSRYSQLYQRSGN